MPNEVFKPHPALLQLRVVDMVAVHEFRGELLLPASSFESMALGSISFEF